MINFDEVTAKDEIHHNSKWPYIPDHPYRILINGASGTGKTNALLNLINEQPDIDKIFLYVKDPYEPKYQHLINRREEVGEEMVGNRNAFIESSNDLKDIHQNIDNYNAVPATFKKQKSVNDLAKRRKVLIVFDNMIADIDSNKTLGKPVTELFIRGRKLGISLVFITQSYFTVPKDIRLNATHYFIMKIPNKRELSNIAINHSADVDSDEFRQIYKGCTKDRYSFLVIDTTLPASHPLRFRKNLFDE